MSNILTCAVNLLEASTVTLTTGAAAPGYPLYRIKDRDIGRVFAGSAAVTTTIKIDQGAAGAQAVDRLFIPAGHNLSGVWLGIAYSSDDSSYTNAVTAGAWASSAADILKSWTSLVRRYWRFTITTPAAAPYFAELFISPTESWARNPQRPGGDEEDVHNVTVLRSSPGRPRYAVNGPSRRQRHYTLKNIGSAQRTQLKALWSEWRGGKPFWLCDHEGVWIYGEITAPLRLRETGAGTWGATLDFLEVPV
jgi:hypothetical protein